MKHESVCRVAGTRPARFVAVVGVACCRHGSPLLLAGAQARAATGRLPRPPPLAADASRRSPSSPRRLRAGGSGACAARGSRTGRAIPPSPPTDSSPAQQMAVYLARALKLPDCQFCDFGTWSAETGGTARSARCTERGSWTARRLLTFSPGAPVSRQEAAALLVAALRYSAVEQGARRRRFAHALPTWTTGWPASRTGSSSAPEYSSPVAIAYRLGLFDVPAEGWLLPCSASLIRNWSRCSSGPLSRTSSTRTAYPARRSIRCRRVSQTVSGLERAPWCCCSQSRLARSALPLRRGRRQVRQPHQGRGLGLREVRAAQADRGGGRGGVGALLAAAGADAGLSEERARGWKWTSPGRS